MSSLNSLGSIGGISNGGHEAAFHTIYEVCVVSLSNRFMEQYLRDLLPNSSHVRGPVQRFEYIPGHKDW